MVNLNKLNAKSLECGLNVDDLAVKVGINNKKLSSKGNDITINEACGIAKVS